MSLSSFSKKFKGYSGIVEFNFARVFTSYGVIFWVTASDNMRSHRFKMEVDKGEWKIINAEKIPEWIYSIENQLSEVILESHPFSV